MSTTSKSPNLSPGSTASGRSAVCGTVAIFGIIGAARGAAGPPPSSVKLPPVADFAFFVCHKDIPMLQSIDARTGAPQGDAWAESTPAQIDAAVAASAAAA